MKPSIELAGKKTVQGWLWRIGRGGKIRCSTKKRSPIADIDWNESGRSAKKRLVAVDRQPDTAVRFGTCQKKIVDRG